MDGTSAVTVSIALRIVTRTSGAPIAREIDGVLDNVDLGVEVGGDVHCCVGDDERLLVSSTSMMEAVAIRCVVRMPSSRATTAPMSPSVWRLPFINASTRPAERGRLPSPRVDGDAPTREAEPADVEVSLLGRVSSCSAGRRESADQAKLVGFDGAAQGDVVARVRDGDLILLASRCAAADQRLDFRHRPVGIDDHR